MIPWGFLRRGRGGLSCLLNCQTFSLSMLFFLFFLTLGIYIEPRQEREQHAYWIRYLKKKVMTSSESHIHRLVPPRTSYQSVYLSICRHFHLFPLLPSSHPTSKLTKVHVSLFLNPRILLLKLQPHLLPLPTNLPRLIQRTHFQTSYDFILPFNNIQCETT